MAPSPNDVETISTDVAVIGSGGAGLMCALHVAWAAPELDVTIVSKGAVGRSGCTRMVQGGFNAVLDPADSVELHFRDTLKGGACLNDQELAWTLVSDARAKAFEAEHDDYSSILLKALADRFAEACTEWLHRKVRT